MAPADVSHPRPVFVGGSARSGTHAIGRLIAAHPRYHLIRTEARFHCFKEGLPDLLAGRVEMDRFLELCRGHWWRRGFRNANGLNRIVALEQRERALEAFRRDFDVDPWAAGRALVGALLDPAAEREGKPSWVEVSGSNVESAPTLIRLFPSARFVNMVRDGRAVVASHLRKGSLTDDPVEALRHWERRVRRADAAIRAAPAGVILTLELDRLVASDRERSYRRVVELLEVEDDSSMREHFAGHISPEAAHVGDWRDRMPPPDARRIDRRYRRLVRELRRDGITWVPSPRSETLRIATLPRPGAGRLRPRSTGGRGRDAEPSA